MMRAAKYNKKHYSQSNSISLSPNNLYDSITVNKKSMFQSSSVQKPSEHRIHNNKKVTLPFIYEKLKTKIYQSTDEYVTINEAQGKSNRNKTEIIPQQFQKIKRKQFKLMRSIDHSLINRKKNENMTGFQKQQAKKYEIYFLGEKKIYSIQQFTDEQGDAKITIGDSILYRYEVKSTLGSGSFGTVFRVFDHKRKEMAALKIIRNHPKLNKQGKVQIKLLQYCLNHDSEVDGCIVKMKHAFFFRGHCCIVFQLLSLNLYEMVKNYNFSGLSLQIIRKFSIQILHALFFLHSHKIIHCDLKPQNILLRKQNKTGIKLADLGSGCFENEQIYNYIQSRYYRAPEIMLNIPYTSAIDLWSFGCILVQLFVGYPLFPGEDQLEQINLFVQILGLPEQYILEQGQRSKLFFKNGELKYKNEKIRKKKRTLSHILRACNDEKFLNLIEQCLVWDPSKRITAKEAFLHPFIVSSLPQNLVHEHKSKLNKK